MPPTTEKPALPRGYIGFTIDPDPSTAVIYGTRDSKGGLILKQGQSSVYIPPIALAKFQRLIAELKEIP